MSDSELVDDVVRTTIEENPELVEDYHNDVHGALNNLMAEANQLVDEDLPHPILLLEFQSQLNE